MTTPTSFHSAPGVTLTTGPQYLSARDRMRAASATLRHDPPGALALFTIVVLLAACGASVGLAIAPAVGSVLALTAGLAMVLALLSAPTDAPERVMLNGALVYGAYFVAMVVSACTYYYAPDLVGAAASALPTAVTPIAACVAPASTPGTRELARWVMALAAGFGAFGAYAGVCLPKVRRPTYDEFSSGWAGASTIAAGGAGVLALLLHDTFSHAAEVVVARVFFGLLLAGAAALGAAALGIAFGGAVRYVVRLTR